MPNYTLNHIRRDTQFINQRSIKQFAGFLANKLWGTSKIGPEIADRVAGVSTKHYVTP